MAMLCACSGEQFRLEEAPQSPESLATRDFSVSGISAKTADWDSRFDDTQVDDVESALKETLSLNYEEARALLGRLEYQRGNYAAALQVFQGIDIRGLRLGMTKAIVERTRAKKMRNKGGVVHVNLMSLHSVSLLIEAILLKSKSLEGLGRDKEAAMECNVILDIVEAAWPNGIPVGIGDDCKLKEMFHKALQLLPQLWKQAGFLEEAIAAYRKAIMNPWDLEPKQLASLQKNLASVLLYGGLESTIPLQLQQIWGVSAPISNVEEAILLLCILLRKEMHKEIDWDPEIMEHLAFALSSCGHFEYLADNYELLFPGYYNRGERWYLLALCYSASGEDGVALDLLRKVFSRAGKKYRKYLPALLLATKLCAQNNNHASEGIEFARKALELVDNRDRHFVYVVNKLLGTCCGYSSRASMSDSERAYLQKESLQALEIAASDEDNNPEVLFHLAVENGVQRNLGSSLDNAIKYSDLMSGSSVRGWKLIALTLSAQQNFKEAETVVDIALDEAGKEDLLELLRLKAVLQSYQGHTKSAIDTHKNLLAIIRAHKDIDRRSWVTEAGIIGNFEMETWLDLANLYTRLGLKSDSEICLNKAKLFGSFSSRMWHTEAYAAIRDARGINIIPSITTWQVHQGLFLQASSLQNVALANFFTSLCINPDHVASMISAASILMDMGKDAFPMARSLLMNALRLDPMNHNAWLNLGHISKAEGLLLQAADCFQAAYELKLSSPVLDIT